MAFFRRFAFGGVGQKIVAIEDLACLVGRGYLPPPRRPKPLTIITCDGVSGKKDSGLE